MLHVAAFLKKLLKTYKYALKVFQRHNSINYLKLNSECIEMPSIIHIIFCEK